MPFCHIVENVVCCSGPDEIQFNEIKTQRLSKPVQVHLRRYNACVTQFA